MKQLIPIALASVLAIACSDDGNLSSANDVERVYHVHDTTYIDTFTITDTLVLTSVDTLVINNTDTSIITHTDTNYITKVDTQYITQHDTIYVEDDEDEVVVVHDTIKQVVYDTVTETLHDTITIVDAGSNTFDITKTRLRFAFYAYTCNGSLCKEPTYVTECHAYTDTLGAHQWWYEENGYSSAKLIWGTRFWGGAGNDRIGQCKNETDVIGKLAIYGEADCNSVTSGSYSGGTAYYVNGAGINVCSGTTTYKDCNVRIQLCD